MSESEELTCWCFQRLRGVAEEVASSGTGQVGGANSAGQESIRKALPTSAGLKMLLPVPPKAIFPTRMAKAEPTAGIQSGTDGGRHRARRRPVTTAEAPGCFFIIWQPRHSEKRAEAMEIRTITKALQPKACTPQAVAGRRERITATMMRLEVVRALTCGGGDTVRLCITASPVLRL
jgi:hypothetical protein